jgi:hypothetical protein
MRSRALSSSQLRSYSRHDHICPCSRPVCPYDHSRLNRCAITLTQLFVRMLSLPGHSGRWKARESREREQRGAGTGDWMQREEADIQRGGGHVWQRHGYPGAEKGR